MTAFSMGLAPKNQAKPHPVQACSQSGAQGSAALMSWSLEGRGGSSVCTMCFTSLSQTYTV